LSKECFAHEEVPSFMGRLTFATGTLILIIGFIIYQFGLLITLHQATFTGQLVAIFPGGSSLDLIGVALEFGGGILGLIGLVICISNAISTQRKETLREIRELKATLSKMLTPKRRCKFCGAEIDEQATFCPVCNRSQR